MKKILKEDKKKIDEEDFKDEITRFYNFFLNHTILQFVLNSIFEERKWSKREGKRIDKKEQAIDKQLRKRGRKEEELMKEKRKRNKG